MTSESPGVVDVGVNVPMGRFEVWLKNLDDNGPVFDSADIGGGAVTAGLTFLPPAAATRMLGIEMIAGTSVVTYRDVAFTLDIIKGPSGSRVGSGFTADDTAAGGYRLTVTLPANSFTFEQF